MTNENNQCVRNAEKVRFTRAISKLSELVESTASALWVVIIIYILLTWAIFPIVSIRAINWLYCPLRYMSPISIVFCLFASCWEFVFCDAYHKHNVWRVIDIVAAHYINRTIINTTTRKSPASPWPLSFSIAAWQKPVCRWPDISFVYQTAVLEPEPQASQTNNLWRIFLQRCKKTQKAFSRDKKKKVFFFRSARTSQSTFDVRTATKILQTLSSRNLSQSPLSALWC